MVEDKFNRDMNDDEIVYKDLSYKIMKACFEVHNVLGPGYPEKIYEEAVARELNYENVSFERQKLIEVLYKGERIGEYRLDMVAENIIILELKAVSEMNDIFESQLLSYLKATGIKLGILINFGGKRVEYKRILK